MFDWINQAVNSVKALFSPPAKPPSQPRSPVVATFKGSANLQGSRPTIQGSRTLVQGNPVRTQGSNYNPQRTASAPVINRQSTAQRNLAVSRAKAQQTLKVAQAKAQKDLQVRVAGAKDEFEQLRARAKYQAIEESKRFQNSRGGFGDFASGGFSSEIEARQYAQQKVGELQAEVSSYEKRLESFSAEKARREQAIATLATSGSQEQYNKAVTEAQAWLDSEVNALNTSAYTIEGRALGYYEFSNSALSSFGAKVGQAFDPKNNPITAIMSGIFRYTLGEGDENIPSLVSLPSRALNFAGNVSGVNKDVRKYDGTSEKTNSADWGKAWQQTQKQRNLNIGNTSNTFDRDKEIESSFQDSLRLYKKRSSGNDNIPWHKGNLPTKQQWLKEDMYTYENGRRIKAIGTTREKAWFEGRGLEGRKNQADIASNTLEFLADPLWLAPSIKGSKTLGKLGEGLNKVGGRINANPYVQKLKDSKVGQGVKWLGEEKKTAKQDYFEKQAVYNDKLIENQAKYMPKIVALQKKIGDNRVDFKLFDDLSKLSDDEAAILQRMTGLNTFAIRDQMKVFGSGEKKVRREFLLNIQKRQQANARLMKGSDDVQSTRFDDRYWSGGWSPAGNKNQYDFRSQRRKGSIQSAEQLRSSQIERYLASSIDDAGTSGDKVRNTVTEAQKELNKLKGEYQEISKLGRPEMEKAFKKINSRSEKFARSLGIPMQVWKTAVLALRPAWYVNNKIYNTFAGLNTAGLGFIPESLGMLRKGALRQAREESPEVVSKIGKYLDDKKNPLWKPASALEDADRLAAYRSLIKQGKTPEEALKRVNDYFFKYTTKNWERPLKTAMPFWAWTKGTAGAAVRMPFDRPLSAKLLSENEKMNQRELSKLPEDMRKYYEGRQFFGNDESGNPRFANAPFNPFSSGTFDSVSANPFISALSELSTQKDFYGNPLDDKSILSAFMNKFPQIPLARQVADVWRQNNGDLDKTIKYFSNRGSEGYRMTKERQGLDPDATNYNSKLDSRDKMGQNFLAYLGVPRGSTFDRAKYEREQKLTDLNQAYFDVDWSKKFPDYNQRIQAQKKLASDYGFDLEKDLFNGYWTKNDSQLSKDLKEQKEFARNYLSDFWNEYHSLPQDGNRNVWVKEKMKKIVDSGVIAENPFILDGLPDWFDPNSREKATAKQFWNKYWSLGKDSRRTLLEQNPKYNKFASRGTSQKALDYRSAKSSGDWTSYQKKYGFSSQKQADYVKANESGDWTSYAEKYQPKNTEASKFWTTYFASSDKEKKQLMADNPKYNKFKDDKPKTQDEWDRIIARVKADRKTRAMSNKQFASFFELRRTQALADQERANRRASVNTKRIVWKK